MNALINHQWQSVCIRFNFSWIWRVFWLLLKRTKRQTSFRASKVSLSTLTHYLDHIKSGIWSRYYFTIIILEILLNCFVRLPLHQKDWLNPTSVFFSVLTSEPVQLRISRSLCTALEFSAWHYLWVIVTKIRLKSRRSKFLFFWML